MNRYHHSGLRLLPMLFLAVIISLNAYSAPYTRVHPVETIGTCDLPFQWRSLSGIRKDGFYRDTVVTRGRTDINTPVPDTLDIYILEFFTHPIRTVHAEITEGSKLSYRGKDYTAAGTYFDTLPGAGGCDSLVRLYITYADYFHMYDTAHLCEGGSYTKWRNRELSQPGNYFDSLTSAGGKDSIYQMTLIVHFPAETWDTVKICPTGDHYYYWNGKRYNANGDYTMNIKSPYGCDSTCHLHLEFLSEPKPKVITEYFCSNIGVVIGGTPYYTTTTMIDTFPSVSGCDSVVETHYIPYPTYFYEQVLQHFEGDPVVWRDKVYTEDGIYYDSLQTVSGCDSVYQLRLVTKKEIYRTVNRCEGETVMHGNTEVLTNRIFIDTLRTKMGGDSIIHTTYNFGKPFFSYEDITICSNQYVIWEGHEKWSGPGTNAMLHEAGTYRDAHHTVTGCDSVYEIHVNVLPAYLKDSVIIMCTDSLAKIGGHITWTDSKGMTHTFTSTTFLDTTIIDTLSHTGTEFLNYPAAGAGGLAVEGGCDSIFRLRVVITDRCSSLERIPMCLDESVTVDGIVYTEPGRYSNLLSSSRNIGLRDSTHSFEIYTVYPETVSIDTTVCQKDLPFFYNESRLTESGDYDFHLQTRYGCDSLVQLHLTVIPTKYSPIQEELFCPGERFEFTMPNGRVITRPGDYYDTIPWSGSGEVLCDSIVRWRIKWAPTYYKADTAYFKPGECYPWHRDGQPRMLCEEGVYWDSCKNVYGCDSIYYLYLKEAKPFFMQEPDVSLCTSQLPWTWPGHNKLINEPGVYYDSCKTYFGLDSVYQVRISIYPSYLNKIQVFICPEENYYVNNVLVTGTEYREEQQTVDGCDSVTIYYINRSILTRRDETARFAENTTYPWRGKEYTHGGDFYDTIRSQLGCDSIIYHLRLIEEHSYHYKVDTAVCLGDDEHFEWKGKLYRTSGTYYDSLTTVFGLDSVWQLNLTVNTDTLIQWQDRLCTGGTYNFFGHEITSPGIYRTTFPRMFTGCDSVIQLNLQAVSTEETVLHHILCEGESILIGDSNVTTSGIYRDTLASSLGCDSVVRHVVTVGKSFFQSTEQLINPGSSYTWHKNGQPVVYTRPGTYWDSCTTILGCDSIYKLTLRFNQTEYIFPTERDYVCSADLPYVWHHRSLTETGLYYDSLKTDKGLDSVYSIYLTVFPTIRTREELNFCDGERPVINGIPYESDAVFTDTLTSYTGCDSIVDYVLHFRQNYSVSLVKNIRDGESYTLGDTVITTSGVYYRHFYSVYGCDSLVTVTVKACPNTREKVIYHDLCQGDQLTIGGKVITTSGTYHETRTASDGCDSLVTHIVNVHTKYLFSTSDDFCYGSSYVWRGHHHDTVLTNQGVYYDSLTTVHGCDSIYRLILNYKRVDRTDTIISICRSDLPFTYQGAYYYRDTVFADTLGMNTEGCDSILRWHFRVNEHCSDYVQYNHCQGEIINIDGLIITKEGVYQQHHLTEDGQDSLYRFTVRNVPRYEITTKQYGCDSVIYDGKTYYARGAGRETFTVDLSHKTVDGCDSIEHLILTIYMSSPVHYYNKTIADYDSVRFGPYYYNTTGSYSLNYTNIRGCDSTEVLNLTVLKTEYPDIVHYFTCQSDPRGVEVFGRIVHPTADYTYISDTTWIAGKPIIRTADIVLQHPFTVTRFNPYEDQILCSDQEVMFYVDYTTKDPALLPDYYEVDFYVGNIEAHPIHQEGTVDGKNTLPITLSGQGRYVTPGTYKYRLKLRSESCVASDTILEGSVVVRYPESIMESGWNDVVMLVNENYNGGGWIFRPPYKWQVLSAQEVDKTARVVTDASQPYLYSSELEEGDRITAFLYREGYDTPVPSCEYVFKPAVPVMDHSVLVYPSAVRRNMPVTVSSSQPGSYRLVSETGRTCNTGSVAAGETLVTMPAREGCYIIKVTDENGNSHVQKLIVY